MITDGMKRFVPVFAMALLGLSIVSCNGKVDARAMWRNVLKGCSASDLLGANVLFMGSSSDLGAGTILRRTSDGGYNLRWRASSVGYPGYPGSVIAPGVPSTCSGNSTVKSKLSPSVDVGALVPGLGASASADIKRGREVTVSVGSWQMEQIEEGPVEAAFKEKKIAEEVQNDVVAQGRFVISKAILVHGLTAEISYDSSTTADLKLKYTSPTAVTVGAGLQGEWTANGTLKISSTKDIYIAAELSQMNLSGFGRATRILVPVQNLEKATFSLE
jgi:hypothetical protein